MSQYSQFGLKFERHRRFPIDAMALALSQMIAPGAQFRPRPPRPPNSQAPAKKSRPARRIHAVPERGAHDGQSRRAAASRRSDLEREGVGLSRRWIVCVCAFKGGWREVRVGGYSELFFLDEPTALAAGHRPCFECRRQAAKAFLAAFPGRRARRPDGRSAACERVENRRKAPVAGAAGDLPEGAMIARSGRTYAVRSGCFRRGVSPAMGRLCRSSRASSPTC